MRPWLRHTGVFARSDNRLRKLRGACVPTYILTRILVPLQRYAQDGTHLGGGDEDRKRTASRMRFEHRHAFCPHKRGGRFEFRGIGSV
jgi:hypothetical protein